MAELAEPVTRELTGEIGRLTGAAGRAARHRGDVACVQLVAGHELLQLVRRPGRGLRHGRPPDAAALVHRRARHLDPLIDEVLARRHALVDIGGDELDRRRRDVARPAPVQPAAVPDQGAVAHHREPLRAHEAVVPVGIGDLAGVDGERHDPEMLGHRGRERPASTRRRADQQDACARAALDHAMDGVGGGCHRPARQRRARLDHLAEAHELRVHAQLALQPGDHDRVDRHGHGFACRRLARGDQPPTGERATGIAHQPAAMAEQSRGERLGDVAARGALLEMAEGCAKARVERKRQAGLEESRLGLAQPEHALQLTQARPRLRRPGPPRPARARRSVAARPPAWPYQAASASGASRPSRQAARPGGAASSERCSGHPCR